MQNRKNRKHASFTHTVCRNLQDSKSCETHQQEPRRPTKEWEESRGEGVFSSGGPLRQPATLHQHPPPAGCCCSHLRIRNILTIFLKTTWMVRCVSVVTSLSSLPSWQQRWWCRWWCASHCASSVSSSSGLNLWRNLVQISEIPIASSK